MLTLLAPQLESLWDESLPVEVKELPEDLAALDRLLSDPELLWPLVERWQREFHETGRLVLTEGRPTIAMETYIRLMALKQRYRWGYRTLVAEVSDSIHLRRFCRISLSERVPDESTVRKLTRRIGAETVSELTRALIVKAAREKRFRPRAVRIDSTVIEADVKYPTDAGLASSGVKVLAREGRKLAKLIKERKARVRDRSRAMGHKLRTITRTIRRRSGEAKEEVLKLTGETGALLERSIREARRIEDRQGQGTRSWRAGEAKGLRRGGDGGSLREGRAADPPACRGEADQGQDRLAARSGRAADPQGEAGEAQRIRVREPVAEVTEHPRGRARVDPAGRDRARQPGRGHAAAADRRGAQAARDQGAGGRVRWWVQRHSDEQRARGPSTETVFIAGRQEPA